MSADRPALGARQAAPSRTQPPRADPPRRRTRRRRWPIVLLVVLLVLLVLTVVAYLVAERIVRQQAEAQIARTVEADLPAGVTGGVVARIDDALVIPDLLRQRFDHVTLTGKDLRVGGAPAGATVQLYGLPTDGGTIERATADLSVGQAAFHDLPALTQVHASDPVLGNGTVGTTVTQTILGLPVTVKVVLTPQLEDQVVRLRTKSATISAGPANVPATAIVQQLLPNGISVCAASYLPQGVRLQSLTTRTGAVTAGLATSHLDLDHLDTAEHGTCS